jgi:hypothetical protein
MGKIKSTLQIKWLKHKYTSPEGIKFSKCAKRCDFYCEKSSYTTGTGLQKIPYCYLGYAILIVFGNEPSILCPN